MEKLIVKAHFHTAHRQLGFPGHCRFVHGHTWRGKVTITCEEFPRDNLDMSIDFGDLKKVMRDLDHKIIVTKDDVVILNEENFESEGVILIPGRGPSVENVAVYIWDGCANCIREKFPNKNIDYNIEVEIQETDNNFFAVEKSVTI